MSIRASGKRGHIDQAAETRGHISDTSPYCTGQQTDIQNTRMFFHKIYRM